MLKNHIISTKFVKIRLHSPEESIYLPVRLATLDVIEYERLFDARMRNPHSCYAHYILRIAIVPHSASDENAITDYAQAELTSMYIIE